MLEYFCQTMFTKRVRRMQEIDGLCLDRFCGIGSRESKFMLQRKRDNVRQDDRAAMRALTSIKHRRFHPETKPF